MLDPEEDGVPTIRDTLVGQCIGATILDITTTDTDEFLESGGRENFVYLHLSNGSTMFARMQTEKDAEPNFGMLDDDKRFEDGEEIEAT
jgi:hypothetical protein